MGERRRATTAGREMRKKKENKDVNPSSVHDESRIRDRYLISS